MTLPDPASLFTRYHRDVYRFLLRMTGRPDEAEDLAQEVFVRALRALGNGSGVSHERGWVFSIARAAHADRRRASSRRPEAPWAAECEEARPGTQALAYGLQQALTRLPEPDREVFLLREVGGLSYGEIGSATASSVEAVRSRLHRARIALRADLGPGIV